MPVRPEKKLLPGLEEAEEEFEIISDSHEFSSVLEDTETENIQDKKKNTDAYAEQEVKEAKTCPNFIWKTPKATKFL